MNDLITKTGVKLGNTQDGSNWCMKALNPAAPISISGIPDSSALARVVKHYERTVTIAFPAAAANWSLDVLLHSNPWIPAAYLTNDGVTSVFTPVYNTQLGASDQLIRDFLVFHTEAYRVCYASMTAIMDSTSITNSGLVAATQYTLVPISVSPNGPVYNAGITRPFEIWPDPPRNYDQLIQMPGTHVGEAKEGVYIPLRLDSELAWVHSNNYKCHINTDDAVALGWTGVNAVSTAFPVASVPSWPFGIVSSRSNSVASFQFCNSQRTVAHIAMRNLNPAATIRITYRLGFEFLVAPGTNYSPDLRMPPLYDPLAIESFKAVAASLKLAYPASYNDWQKIVKTISDIASTVLPFLPGGQILSALVPGVEKSVLGIGGNIQARVKKRQAARKSGLKIERKPTPQKGKAPAVYQKVVNTPGKTNTAMLSRKFYGKQS